MTDLTPEQALEAARAEVTRALDTAVEAGTSSALVLGRDDAVGTKARLGASYSQITKARTAAAEKVEAAKDLIEAKRRELEEMQRALAAELAPLEKQLARLADGIKAVNLYLGRDEYLEELRDGASAPADTPLVIRQTVLAMDEESALYAETGGLDFTKIEVFTEWLLAAPSHLEQVIPDLKGVVAIMARRTPIDYTGNPLVDADINRKNFQTYWLLRNGERLFIMDTDFSVGDLLIPTRRSFTQLFEDRDGQPLEPGSRSWLEAEEKADVLTRHYMKVALILQGLVDRTAVFHPLPEGGLSLINDADYDSGKVVLIEEEERAIGTGRQPFAEWHIERLKQLAVGQRVIGHFPGSRYYGGSSEAEYISPRFASAPSNEIAHVIKRDEGSSLYFTYDRTDTVDDRDNWGNYRGQKTPERRATYRIDKSEFRTATFVPIDNVTVEEMEEYLGARTERKAYQNMFPALTAAIAFKRAEEEAERPFRNLLWAALAESSVGELITDDDVRELVTWWKTSNKWHRALTGDSEHEKRAASMILKEYKRRHQDVPAAGLKALHAVTDAMVLAVRSGDLIAVVPSQRRYGAGSVPQDVFVNVHVFTRTGKLREVQEWKTLTRAQVARWTILGESARWAEWRLNIAPGLHLPDPAIDVLLEELKAHALTKQRGPASLIKYHEDDRYGAKAIIYWPSEFDEAGDDLEQPYQSFPVAIKQGVGSFEPRSYRDGLYLSTNEWAFETSFDRPKGPRLPKSPHLTNWSGAFPEAIIYRDEALLAQDVRLSITWADKRLRRDRLSSRQSFLARAVYDGWEAYELEQRRLRFVEDFGDPTLWADHEKSQRNKAKPFPLNGNLSNSVLQAFVAAIVAESIDPLGKTVGEVLTELNAPVPGIPEELLPVAFPNREDDDD